METSTIVIIVCLVLIFTGGLIKNYRIATLEEETRILKTKIKMLEEEEEGRKDLEGQTRENKFGANARKHEDE